MDASGHHNGVQANMAYDDTKLNAYLYNTDNVVDRLQASLVGEYRKGTKTVAELDRSMGSMTDNRILLIAKLDQKNMAYGASKRTG